MSKKKSTVSSVTSSYNFDLFVVKFHGVALQPIKDEFIRHLQKGIRRAVFHIDFDEILYRPSNASTRSSRRSRDIRLNRDLPPIQIVIQAIRDFSNRYNEITKQLEKEKAFSIYEYFENDIKDIESRQKNVVKGRKSTDQPIPMTSKSASNLKPMRKTKSKIIEDEEREITCDVIDRREHNRIGSPELLSKTTFILDEPEAGRLVIILVGDINDEFIVDLYQQRFSVLGLLHFTPVESTYDIWLGNNRMYNFIRDTHSRIEDEIFIQRQNDDLKSLGIFTNDLPIISVCLASKYGEQIFRELVWTVYDIAQLKKHYEQYYIEPFHVIDVGMPPDVSIITLVNQVQNLILHGEYQPNGYPAVVSDTLTITAYLDALLGICVDNEKTIINKKQLSYLALATPATRPRKPMASLDPDYMLWVDYRDSFNSIIRHRKTERVLIDESNHILYNTCLYMNNVIPMNFFRLCLDYNTLRQYTQNEYHSNRLLQNKNDISEVNELINEIQELSGEVCMTAYAKVYFTNESSMERLLYLLNEFCDHNVLELRHGNRLFTFERKYNVIETRDELYFLPTRLCFRDFTIFQLEEFLANLKLPPSEYDDPDDIPLTYTSNSNTALTQMKYTKKRYDKPDSAIFIRPRSLKAKSSEENADDQLDINKRLMRFDGQEYDDKYGMNYGNTSQINPDDEQQVYGLPENHPLLIGYNLEDTRQEIKLKTSRFHFDEGSVQLYIEYWCFDMMNAYLKLSLHNTNLYLNSIGHYKDGMISSNLLFDTTDHIHIRALNDPFECAKIVMHYPNGLSIYHHNTYSIQEWQPDNTYTRELRRIFIPQGCVIIFRTSLDLITILRNNGEVYLLYQYEFTTEEGEYEDEFTEQAPESDPIDGNQRKSLKTDETLPPKPSVDKIDNKRSTKAGKKQSKPQGNEVPSSSSSSGVSWTDMLNQNPFQLIADELLYLEQIMKMYSISFINLRLTTSNGRIYNLHKSGKINIGRRLRKREWHDYFLNESYCQRGDGVRFIWTENKMKCYHQDGTVFITEYEEFNVRNYFDEYETLMSESSSHLGENHSQEEGISHRASQRYMKLNLSSINEYQYEEHPSSAKYADYNSLRPLELLMLHCNYASVNFLLSPYAELSVMEICGHNNIRLCLMNMITPYEDEQNEESSEHENSNLNSANSKTSKSSKNIKNIKNIRNQNVQSYTEMLADKDEEFHPSQKLTTFIKISFGDHLHFVVDPVGCDIFTKLKIDESAADEFWEDFEDRNLLHVMRFDYDESLLGVFNYFTNDIKNVKGVTEQRVLKYRFLEHTSEICQIRGLEFMSSPPNFTGYVTVAGNYIMEMKPFKTYHELLQNPYEFYDTDMEKFPQFPSRKTKEERAKKPDPPMVMSVSVIVTIPRVYRSLLTVHQFLNGFSNFSFKDMKKRIKRHLTYLLHPEIAEMARKLWSKNNWRLKKLDHELRLFKEMKRTGLYMAMLKHKQYPNYMHYVELYKEKAANIDFFNFMTSKCLGRVIMDEEVYFPKCPKPKPKQVKKSRIPRRRKQTGMQMPLMIPMPPVILKDNIWCSPTKTYM